MVYGQLYSSLFREVLLGWVGAECDLSTKFNTTSCTQERERETVLIDRKMLAKMCNGF